MPNQPDQNVTVTYDPAATPRWTITPRAVHMTAAGKIIFHRSPGSARWTFVRVNGIPSSWTQGGNPAGSLYTVEDPDTPIQNYPYTITILYNGSEVTSPTEWIEADGPPMVMNE
jgi:hypothetical protein